LQIVIRGIFLSRRRTDYFDFLHGAGLASDSLVRFVYILVVVSYCNLGIVLSIPGSGTKKFVILGSRFAIRLIRLLLFNIPLVALLDLFHA